MYHRGVTLRFVNLLTQIFVDQYDYNQIYTNTMGFFLIGRPLTVVNGCLPQMNYFGTATSQVLLHLGTSPTSVVCHLSLQPSDCLIQVLRALVYCEKHLAIHPLHPSALFRSYDRMQEKKQTNVYPLRHQRGPLSSRNTTCITSVQAQYIGSFILFV